MKNGEKFHFTELLPVFYVQLQRVIPFTFAGRIYSHSIASINFYIFIPSALGLQPSGIGQ